MAPKRFPDETPPKLVLQEGDIILLADSMDAYESKSSTMNSLLELIDLNLEVTDHKNNTSNPHNVSQFHVGLDQVNNTNDLDKPVSTATQELIDTLEVGAKVYTLTTSGSFVPDIDQFNHFDISINDDLIVETPIQKSIGQSGVMVFKQTGTISNVIFGSVWQFPAGVPVINTSDGAANVFKYTVIDDFNILVEFISDWILATV